MIKNSFSILLFIFFLASCTCCFAAPFHPDYIYSANENSGTTRLNTSLENNLKASGLLKPRAKIEIPELRPSIGMGVGNFTFYGDISNNHKGFHPTVSRLAYQLRVAHPLNSYLELEFHTIFGRVSANERDGVRNLNFESQIRIGGISLGYNFDHVLKKRPERHAEPFLALGIESFEFLSKTDKFDKHGNEYHYWSDGSIRNIAESSPNAADAIRIYRDYVYETDLREQNFDGNGKYPERSWAFPVTAGVTFYISDNFKFRMQTSMHFTTTDLVDDVTGESLGDRLGTKGKDKLLFTSFYITYDLQPIKNKEPKDVRPPDPWDEPLFANDTNDTDLDGISNFQDPCPYTPAGVTVDSKGCPLDMDGDRVFDYTDDELPSPAGKFVDKKGVHLTDEALDRFWKVYYDSTGQYSGYEDSVKSIAYSDGSNKLFGRPGSTEIKSKEYVIILDQKKITVTANELHKYLGYQDFKTITEGDTVYYVISGFKDLASAKATNEALNKAGVNTQGIGESGVDKVGKNTVNTVSEYKLDKTDASQGTVKDVLPSGENAIVYRVQIAAFTKPVGEDNRIFEDVGPVTQIKGADGLYRYYSGSFKTLEEASKHKIDMAYEKGFKDAFVVVLKEGKRVSLSTVTEVNPEYNENIAQYDSAVGAGIDRSEIKYRVQLGVFEGDIPTETLELFLSLGDVKPVKDADGKTRYLKGTYDSASEAEKVKNELSNQGIITPVVVGDYKGKLMSLEEVIELLND